MSERDRERERYTYMERENSQLLHYSPDVFNGWG